MFASRNHNENAIYEQQTAAAAKPLNQGLKGLAPKTPGAKAPKTPFKISRNDENATFGPGKTGGKGKQGDEKTNKAERNAFVTPAGPRTRAPLGNKTTNAKAFQTAAPPTEKLSARPTSPRMRRAKVKIHQPDLLDGDVESDEHDIERMPPREIPLPDYPDDWPLDRKYPQFEGNNLTRGWITACQTTRRHEDEFAEFQEKLKKAEEIEKSEGARAAANAKLMAVRVASTSKPSTLKSRNAASSLTSGSKTGSLPSFAAPTTATKARLPSTITRKPTQIPQAPANARHLAAKAASNTTLGYSKGRAVSASARAPLSSIYRQENEITDVVQKASPMKTPFGNGTDLDNLLKLNVLSFNEEANDDDEDDDLGGVSVLPDDDELDEFRLAPVEF
ncbi:Hypothetical protein R9X50_00594200 [Acrodontium crateriforme]|uniref:Uncharacterized protein n=1 Tax=Acrodontium crateriforme TaxID=150365 RepID=A0AAQ3MA99_9PEZI|nr:Hypothetical protein R9X50_00594200 [Acrodontium crateriforme]